MLSHKTKKQKHTMQEVHEAAAFCAMIIRNKAGKTKEEKMWLTKQIHKHLDLATISDFEPSKIFTSQSKENIDNTRRRETKMNRIFAAHEYIESLDSGTIFEPADLVVWWRSYKTPGAPEVEAKTWRQNLTDYCREDLYFQTTETDSQKFIFIRI